jgi:hypothetical protein
MTTPAITEIKEVIKYLKDNNFDIDEVRITAKFNLIGNKIQRVNSPDKKWVSCSESQPHEVEAAVSAINGIISHAINDIISNALANSTVEKAVKKAVKSTCDEFKSKDIADKPRIPFYVVVLHKLSQ